MRPLATSTPYSYASTPRPLGYPIPVVPAASVPNSARMTIGDPMPSSVRGLAGGAVSSARLQIPRFLAAEQQVARSAPITPVRSRVDDSARKSLNGSSRPARVLKSDFNFSFPAPSSAIPRPTSAVPLERSVRWIPMNATPPGSVACPPPRVVPFSEYKASDSSVRLASSSFPKPVELAQQCPPSSARFLAAGTPPRILSATPPQKQPADRTISPIATRAQALPPQWRLKLGAEVPNFHCTTTAGDFTFHDFISGGPPFTLLFSHPADFTPVCTTELGRCETLIADFESRGVQLIGLSCDSVDAHIAWSADILGREHIHKVDGKLSFPLIADANRKIAGSLGMLDPEELDANGIPLPARTLMVIDKQKKVKLAIVYPATTGRSFDEVLRAIDSLILTRERNLATPADWRQGERCIVAAGVPMAEAEKLYDDLITEKLVSGKPYLRHVNCPPIAAQAIASNSSTVSSGVGISVQEDTRVAVMEAIQNALQDVRNPAIAFATCTVDRSIEEVQAAFAEFLPGIPIHGTTSSQSVLHPTGSYAKGVGCLILDAPPGSFACSFADDVAEAASLLHEQMPAAQAIIMSTVPGSEEVAIQTLIECFGVPIYGGTAADNEFDGSWQVFGSDRCSKVGISLVGIGPGVRFGASLIGPYLPTNRRASITRGDGRRAYEIDNVPAADWVYQWLGQSIEDVYSNGGGFILSQTAEKPVGFPLPSGNYQSAHLAQIGGPGEWVEFFAPIVEGQEIVIMDSGDGPATGYAQTFADAYQTAIVNGRLSKPKAGILIFCGGMAIAVGEKLNSGLVNGLQSALDVPILGMTCFGEQTYAPEDNVNLQSNLSLGMILFE